MSRSESRAHYRIAGARATERVRGVNVDAKQAERTAEALYRETAARQAAVVTSRAIWRGGPQLPYLAPTPEDASMKLMYSTSVAFWAYRRASHVRSSLSQLAFSSTTV